MRETLATSKESNVKNSNLAMALVLAGMMTAGCGKSADDAATANTSDLGYHAATYAAAEPLGVTADPNAAGADVATAASTDSPAVANAKAQLKALLPNLKIVQARGSAAPPAGRDAFRSAAGPEAEAGRDHQVAFEPGRSGSGPVPLGSQAGEKHSPVAAGGEGSSSTMTRHRTKF